MENVATEVAEARSVEATIYTSWDVARYLHVPIWCVFALDGRYRGWRDPDWFFMYWHRRFPRLSQFDDDLEWPDFPAEFRRVSFRRFAEMFVRAAALKVLVRPGQSCGRDKDSWDLHHAIFQGLEDAAREAVPFDDMSIEDRVTVVAEPFSQRLKEEQLALLRKWLTLRLERVEVRDGQPVRVEPFSRDPAENSPRIIALDPAIRFGRPIIADRHLPTDIVFERFQAGDSVDDLIKDYDLTPIEIEEAIRFESLPTTPLFPYFGW